MEYPIVIHKDPGSDYGVTVPDLPGCFTAGSTVGEAIAMAREAIELHLEGLIEEGELVPDSSPIEEHKDDPNFAGGIWAVVTISASNLRVSAKRVNVTIPERVLDAVDRYAKEHHETRSGLLVKAVTSYISRNLAPASAPQTNTRTNKKRNRKKHPTK